MQDGESGSGRNCPHSFCIQCIHQYLSVCDCCSTPTTPIPTSGSGLGSPGSSSAVLCPICAYASDDEAMAAAASRRPASQPRDGVMSVTHHQSFKLPGYERTSRGTIVVVYSFPPGVQTVCSQIDLNLLLCPRPYRLQYQYLHRLTEHLVIASILD